MLKIKRNKLVLVYFIGFVMMNIYIWTNNKPIITTSKEDTLESFEHIEDTESEDIVERVFIRTFDVTIPAIPTSEEPVTIYTKEHETIETETSEEMGQCDLFSEPITAYDIFPEDEANLFYQVVQAEVTENWNGQRNVASVIMNRYAMYGVTSLYEIFTAEQFACIADGRAAQQVVTDSTKSAVDWVLNNGDTTGSCLFFDSTNGNSWAAHNREWVFRDEVGHDFYR